MFCSLETEFRSKITTGSQNSHLSNLEGSITLAGRKQHFIPQHFLKSFVINDGNDKLWMYRRGLTKPVPVSRADAAAMRDFYSKPSVDGAPTLDDMITEYEYRLQFLVDDIRGADLNTTLDPNVIGEVVAHLSIRAAYLRELVGLGASEMSATIDTLIHNPADLLGEVKLLKHRVPSEFDVLATEQLEKRGLHLLTNISTKAIVRLLYHAVREDFDILHTAAVDQFTDWVGEFEHRFTNFDQTVHTQVLQDQLVPSARKEQLAALSWQVIECSERNAPIADCVAIAEDENGWGPYILSNPKSIKSVILPLSPSKLAVGSIEENWSEKAQNYAQNAIAGCVSFYISDQFEDVTSNELDGLGQVARETISDLTSSSIRETIEQFVCDTDGENGDHMMKASHGQNTRDTSFTVSLKDFADQPFAQKVSNAVKDVVVAFASVHPIYGLDGITFADDYQTAILELDRGEDVSKLLDGSIGKNPNGVAMPLTVRRGGEIKTHLILKAYLAEDLLSDVNDHKDAAVSLLLNCLGTVAYNSLVDAKFPNTVLSPHADQYEGWLAQFNDALLANYYSITTTVATTELATFYSELALETLEAMIEITTEAHTTYRENGDHTQLFERCAQAMSSFLTALNRVFAAQATLIGPKTPNTALGARLSQLELTKWAFLFESDLSNFMNNLESWSKFEEVYFINRHFERLLFEVGVFPDQLEDGALYIHTSEEHRLNMRLESALSLH